MKKQRIVVKIGSSSLTNSNGSIDEAKIKEHTEAISLLKENGHEVILITSGAVAAGFSALGYPSRPVTIKGKQAAAAVGQTLLMQQYMDHLKRYGLTPAQILLTRNDFSKRERYRNAYATVMELLERGVVPIINENDSTSVEELTFGDNDPPENVGKLLVAFLKLGESGKKAGQARPTPFTICEGEKQ